MTIMDRGLAELSAAGGRSGRRNHALQMEPTQGLMIGDL